jgi:hypothetical protein
MNSESAALSEGEPRLQGVETWNDLYAALRAAGYEKAAGWIESWQDEYLPGQEDELLPKETYG